MPVELISKRDELLASLDAGVAVSTGATQQLLRFFGSFITSLEPKASMIDQLQKQMEFKNAMPGVFKSMMKSLEQGPQNISPNLAPLIVKAQAFINEYVNFLADWLKAKGADAPSEVAAAAAEMKGVAQAMASVADAFASGKPRSASGAMLGNVDAPIAGGPEAPKREIPEDLKNWKNPMLGIRGK